MDNNTVTREDKIMFICEALKAQTEGEQAQDNATISMMSAAYDLGVRDGMALASEQKAG